MLNESDEVVWKDPTTGECFMVDQRTGNSYPRTMSSVNRKTGELDRVLESSRRTLSRTLDCAHQTGEEPLSVPGWIEDALQVCVVLVIF